jgi:hypothetical protein
MCLDLYRPAQQPKYVSINRRNNETVEKVTNVFRTVRFQIQSVIRELNEAFVNLVLKVSMIIFIGYSAPSS